MKRLVMLTMAVAVMIGFAQTGFAAGKSLTGTWEITIEAVRDSGRPPEVPKTLTFRMEWLDTGRQVFGSMETSRWVGQHDGLTLKFQVFSHGNNDRDVKRGGIQLGGNVDLRQITAQSGGGEPTWTGVGCGLEPAAGVKAFETFKVSARRVSTAPGGVVGINWCELFNLNELLQEIFDDTFFHPMDVCSAEKNGEGFYLFGSVGPGNIAHPYAAVTTYYPWDWHAVCSSRDYSFAINAGGNIATIQMVIDGLQAYTAFLNYLGLDATTIGDDLLSWYTTYGEFAISIGYSMESGFTTMYINTGSATNTAICDAIVNSATGQAIQKVFDHGKGFAVKCGTSITDSYTLRRTAVPAGLYCNSPVIFVYLFGTINVVYD